jgi:hypothetical protein
MAVSHPPCPGLPTNRTASGHRAREGQTDGDLKDEEREIKRVHSFLVAILWTAN